MARLKKMTPEEVAAAPDVEAIARALAAPVNAKRLEEPSFVAAVVTALASRGDFDAAFAVAALHTRAFRDSPALNVLAAMFEAGLASGASAHLEQALRAYERILRRDPSDLYLVGRMHADALECAVRLGQQERGFTLLERLLDHHAPGRLGRTLPDGFPIDDPRLVELWTRPAQRTLARALAAERAARARPRRRR